MSINLVITGIQDIWEKAVQCKFWEIVYRFYEYISIDKKNDMIMTSLDYLLLWHNSITF